jgi:hypothetical protein
MYDRASAGGLKLAAEKGNKLLEWDAGEKEKIQALIDDAMTGLVTNKVGDSTIGDVIKLMKGQ